MSEGTHSTPAEATQVASSPLPGNTPRFSPAQKRKFAYIAGGTIGVVIVGAALFQVFRPETGIAGPGTAGGSAPRDLSRHVATVGGRPITERELADECIARHGREILDGIINRRIIQQACARQNVTISATEVDKEIFRIAKKFGMEPASWFQMLQAERNITQLQYKRDIIWPMLALKKIAGAVITKPTDQELQTAFVREYGPRVEARMILFDNQRRAGEVHNELMRIPGSDSFERRTQFFAQLAQKHSIEPTSRALGGVIPPIRRYSGNKKLEDVAFGMRKGQISPIINVGGTRYVILMSEGLTKPVVTDIAQVRNALYDQLTEEKTQQAVAQIFTKLRNQTRVDNRLTGTTSGVQQASATGSPAGRARVGGPAPAGGSYPRPSTAPRNPRSRIQ